MTDDFSNINKAAYQAMSKLPEIQKENESLKSQLEKLEREKAGKDKALALVWAEMRKVVSSISEIGQAPFNMSDEMYVAVRDAVKGETQ